MLKNNANVPVFAGNRELATKNDIISVVNTEINKLQNLVETWLVGASHSFSPSGNGYGYCYLNENQKIDSHFLPGLYNTITINNIEYDVNQSINLPLSRIIYQ